MNLTTKSLILVAVVFLSWSRGNAQPIVTPDSLGTYSIQGYIHNMEKMPLKNIHVAIVNWGNRYEAVSENDGFFYVEFPVKKEDYDYNRQVAVRFYTADDIYEEKRKSIPVRQFNNGQYIIEETQLHPTGFRDAGNRSQQQWARIKALQAQIDSLENLLSRETITSDSLRQYLSQLRAERDAEFRDYIVKPGDYLIKIAGDSAFYNDPDLWRAIYDANREKIKDPDLIYPSQVLKIPADPQSLSK